MYSMCCATSLKAAASISWIEEDDLLQAMDSQLDREARRRLLANMVSRGLLEEGAGKWRASR
jgi:hypothetical protein